MTEVHVCAPLSRLVREVADKATGAPPDAITLGEYVLIFAPLPTGEDLARLRRHEAVHVEQQAALAPSWARWLPQPVRVMLGAPKFYRLYYAEYRTLGYENISFEREARAAE